MRRKNIPTISYCLILFAILFGITQENDFILGDFVFSKLGLPLWSNGATGIHYSGILSIFLVLIALLGIIINSDLASSRLKKLAFMTLLFGPLLIKPIFIESYGLIKGLYSGLNAIDYYRSESTSTFESTYGDKVLRISSRITLVNYGQDVRDFYIKLIPDIIPERLTEDKYLLAIDEEMKPRKFKLLPRTKTTVNAVFMAKQKEGIQNTRGSFNASDIVIYNDHEEIKFIKGQ